MARFISHLISFVLAEPSCGARKESENYKMKNSCPEWDSIPLDWCFHQLFHRTNLIVDIEGLSIYTYRTMSSKISTKKEKYNNFKFYFIIYRDLIGIVFSKRFPTINIQVKFNTEQNVCCRVYHCVRDEKCI